MGVSDMFGKAKDLLGEHVEQVDEAIDKATDVVKEKTPDNVDGLVDKAGDAAKGAVAKDG